MASGDYYNYDSEPGGSQDTLENLLISMQKKQDHMERRQEEMYRQMLHLQHTNARLLSLIESNAHQQPIQAIDAPPPSYHRGQCTYFFRIFHLNQNQVVEERKLLSPDFYLSHLGFKAWYRVNPVHKSHKEMGIYLTYFGSNGPSSVRVKVRILLRSTDETLEDTLLGEHSGIVNMASKESIAFWVKGYSVNMKGSDMKNQGSASPPNRVIRFDVIIE